MTQKTLDFRNIGFIRKNNGLSHDHFDLEGEYCFLYWHDKTFHNVYYCFPDFLPDFCTKRHILASSWDESIGIVSTSVFLNLVTYPHDFFRHVMIYFGTMIGDKGDYWYNGFYFYDKTHNCRVKIELNDLKDYSLVEISVQIADKSKEANVAKFSREITQTIQKLREDYVKRHKKVS